MVTEREREREMETIEGSIQRDLAADVVISSNK